MKRTPAVDLADRLARPHRVGLFGHRGVGKTTLLATLYREAVAGRLPGLRLAAADQRTAEYLADKVQQLEAGHTLPATLAQTELRFNLYRGDARIELVLLDYQGEHVELGREEPAREFLRECDAIWVCLDAPSAEADTWPAEQRVEQLVEDHLAQQDAGQPPRPMAIVVTKADLLEGPADGFIAADPFPLTRHAVVTHSPDHATFTVSTVERIGGVPVLQPEGLEGPLTWLVDALQRLDRARLARLFETTDDVPLLRRAVAAFRRRYPSDPLGEESARKVRWDKRLWRRVGIAAGLVVALAALAWGYDAHGASRIAALDAKLADDPIARRQAWRDYRAWYPTRFVFGTGRPDRAADADRAAAVVEHREQIAELGRRATDPDADGASLWREYLTLREAQPDVEPDAAGLAVRDRLRVLLDAAMKRADAARDQRGRAALRELEQRESTLELPALIERAAGLAREYADSPVGAEIEKRARSYRDRLDERDFESARDYSARSPGNFLTRRQKFQAYLDGHPGGNFASRARDEIARVGREWDRADYRKVRDVYAERPGELKELRTLGRSYLSTHPDGKYRDAVTQLLRWCDQVSEPGQYTVKLVSGVFDRKAAFWASRGLSLSVTIEVGGTTYGPSTIQKTYYPEWDFEFPRQVRWKSGDSVRVIVRDHYLWKRTLADLTFDDAVAMRHLSDLLDFKNGSVRFESDFKMPTLPKVD